MTVAARSGPAQVISAGSITTFEGNGLALEVRQPEGQLRLELSFRTDPAVEDVAVDSTFGDAGVSLVLTNFDKADGRGSARPVLLGVLGPDALYFHFRVHRYGRTPDRTIHYTVYRVAGGATDTSG